MSEESQNRLRTTAVILLARRDQTVQWMHNLKQKTSYRKTHNATNPFKPPHRLEHTFPVDLAASCSSTGGLRDRFDSTCSPLGVFLTREVLGAEQH